MPILKDELRKRKLRVTGNKNDLVQRLQEYDNNLDIDFEEMDNNDMCGIGPGDNTGIITKKVISP